MSRPDLGADPGVAQRKADEISLWVDRLAEYDLAPSAARGGTQELLKFIADVWGPEISPEELDIFRQVVLNTEELVDGELPEAKWLDRMNGYFNQIREGTL